MQLGGLWLFLVVMSIVAVSGQSLWIDEANSAVKAIQPTGEAFVNAMRDERGSDLQMPLYMLSLWGWEKLVGPSEYALRSMNIPIFLAGISMVFAFLSCPGENRFAFGLFSICSPMVWAYLDEARPYILQFTAATWVMVGLVNLSRKSAGEPSLRDAVLTFSGILLLSASSLMGVIFSFFFGVAFLWLWLRIEPLSASLRRPLLWFLAIGVAAILSVLAIYYIWTLGSGARASGVGHTGVLSLAFCAYELLGFSGFGPGRFALRESPVKAIVPFLPLLFIYAAILAAFLLYLVISTRHALLKGLAGRYLPIALAVLASLATVCALGFVEHFRVVGRHLMPILPFLIFAISQSAFAMWKHGGFFPRTLVVAVLLSGLFSSLSLRFSARFKKDDYRSAATIARQLLGQGKSVWWAADPAGARYYGVAVSLRPDGSPDVNSRGRSQEQTSGAFYVANLVPAALSQLPQPAMVILSKTDIYDGAGHLRSWAGQNSFTIQEVFPAFQIFRHK